MEILNVVTARSVWLFDLNEMNPRGKDFLGDLLDWLEERYNFKKVPKSTTDVDDAKALVFAQGNFQVREEIFVAVDLRIFTDGLVANTWSSTHDTDAFLEDVLKSAASEFSLVYQPEIVRRKMYLSELNVKSSKEPVGVNPMLAQFANMIHERLPAKVKLPYEFAGVAFFPIQGIAPVSISPFRLERKLNTAPEEHKYYTTAPLHTDDHLELLKWFEEHLMS